MMEPMALSPAEAEDLLADADVVPAMQLGILEAKRLQAACLADDIPAALGRDDHCTKGCSPKLMLLVREADVPRLSALLSRGWLDELRRNGTVDLSPRTAGSTAGEADPDADPPCPACGHQGPLVDDACADCGLGLG